MLTTATTAHESAVIIFTRARYQVTKNISDLGVILSIVFERAICKLKAMSLSPGENKRARS